MTDTYTTLPEDLELIETSRTTLSEALVVRITGRNIGLTAGAYRALGQPQRL